MNNGANELKFGHTSFVVERGEMPKKLCGLQSCHRSGSTNSSSKRQRSLSKRGNAEIVCVSKRGNAQKALWTSKLSQEWEHGREFQKAGVVVVQLVLVCLVCGWVFE